MNRRVLRTGLLAAGFLVSFLAGAVVGNRWTFSWMHGVLQTEVQGNLNFHLNALAALRLEEPETAIRLLDAMVDPAVASLPQRREWHDLPVGMRRNLLLAKKYRERYPSERSSPYYAAAYAFVPDEPVDWGSCRGPICRLLEGAEAR